MSISFDRAVAADTLRRAAAGADAERYSKSWFDRVARLSRLCEHASKTHLAYLGTAILAKALRTDVDLHAIKPSGAPGNPRAYSARNLCHAVLVPMAVDLGFSLGVTGREPLNNQPYFRIIRVGDGTPVRNNARPAFDYLLELLDDLGGCSKEEASEALAAFVAERRLHRVRYDDPDAATPVSLEQFLNAVRAFVDAASEGGRRAQAVVAGLMDAFAGPDRVVTGRINDPSRRHPGDVCVRADGPEALWERALEVRDKPVALSDIQLFANKCIAAGVREAAVVAVAAGQSAIDRRRLAEWSVELGIGVTVFIGWAEIVEQTMFWADEPTPEAARHAVGHVYNRLIEVEATGQAVALWSRLTAAK